MASKALSLRLAVPVVAALLLTGCATSGNLSDEGPADRTSNTVELTVERTSVQAGGGTIKGVITEINHTNTGHWILVEADPDADCRMPRNVRNDPGCDKISWRTENHPESAPLPRCASRPDAPNEASISPTQSANSRV